MEMASELVTILKEIAVLGAAVFASIVAWKGLNTWRRQLAGQVEHDLAHKILTSLLLLREEVSSIRKSGMVLTAMLAREEFTEALSEPCLIRDYFARAEPRLDSLANRKADLELCMLEGEIVWGDELIGRVARFQGLVEEFSSSLKLARIVAEAESILENTRIKEELNGARSLRKLNSNDGVDPYADELRSAVEDVKAVLVPKLLVDSEGIKMKKRFSLLAKAGDRRKSKTNAIR